MQVKHNPNLLLSSLQVLHFSSGHSTEIVVWSNFNIVVVIVVGMFIIVVGMFVIVVGMFVISVVGFLIVWVVGVASVGAAVTIVVLAILIHFVSFLIPLF